MNRINILPALIFSVLLFACNTKNGNANSDNNTIAKMTETSDAPSSGDASFSYKINGRLFFYKGTDNGTPVIAELFYFAAL